MALELAEESSNSRKVVIKVIGIGGGGCNAIHQMTDFHVNGVELFVANTDMQVLQSSPIEKKIQLGAKLTEGFGAGADPEVGRLAAEEDRERIQEALAGADVVFLASGFGGGTGTGATPVFAEVAREMGIITLAIVTKPFFFEGPQRMRKAEEGIKTLKKAVDCLIVIPNDRISMVMGSSTSLLDSFKTVDAVLKDGVQSIAQVIYDEGLINPDLNDLKAIMSERGIALIGTGEAEGENRAEVAADKAISSPLLENIDISRAKGLLFNIMCDRSLSHDEMRKVGEVLTGMLESEETNVVTGVMINENMNGVLRVTVLATGISSDEDDEHSEEEHSSSGDGYIDLDVDWSNPPFLRKRVK